MRRRVLVPIALLAAYALAGFLLLPALLGHYLPGVLRQHLGVEASLGAVRFNPFVFTLEIRDVRLAEPEHEPLLQLGRLFADFELSSLFRRAWTFAEFRVERPELDLVREADGRLNLQRVLAALPAATAEEEAAGADATPPRVLLLAAHVAAARLRYSDRSREPQASAEIGPADFDVGEIATLPGRRGGYALSAALPGGARLEWTGQGGLLPVTAEGTVRVIGFQPRAIWDFVQPAVRLAPPQGVIDLAMDFHTELEDGQPRLLVGPLTLFVNDLALQRTDGTEPLLALRSVEFNGGRLDLAARTLNFAELRLGNGRLAAHLDRTGVADWATLLVNPPQPASASAPVAADGAPWRIGIGRVSIDAVKADVRDDSRHAPLGFGLLARRIGFGVTLQMEAEGPRIELSDGAAELADIALTTGTSAENLAHIDTLTLEGAAADVNAQSVSARHIALQGLSTSLHRRADGSLREIELMSTPDPAVPLPVTSAAAEWRLRADELAFRDIDAAYSDEMTVPAIAYAVRDGQVVLSGVDTGSAAPVGVDLRLPVVEGGSIAMTGTAAGDGSSAALKLAIDGLAMTPLAPLVAQRTTLTLGSGVLSTQADLSIRAAPGAATEVRATASLGVDDLLLTEAATGERLLAWRSLAASGIEFGLAPDRLQVRELRLREPGAKVVVHKDRTTNLGQILREDTAAPPSAAAPFPVAIERVRIDDGTLDFADHGLVLPFVVRVERLAGVMRGISSSATGRATLKFAGHVGEFGEAEIDGQLEPFDPAHYTDIEVAFRNIAMNQLSPYSATFAGRTIASGDLDLDLGYSVTRGALNGDNKLVLQDFRLGDAVDSPGAADLPLDLAIALLTDSAGRIDLAVPVTGDMGDPRFSYGHLFGQALGNVLRGVVTAPFRALGSVFGGEPGGGADLQSVRFKSGSAELMPREKERLARLAEALAARPQLGVGVPVGVEPERDGYALRRTQVRREHAALMEIELEPGEDPGPVSYDGAKSQRALERLLEQREGEHAPDAFAAGWAKEHGGAPDRVSAALALLGRGAGDADYYRELYLYLVRSTPEPGAELDALAQGRTQAIAAELRARGLAPERVRSGKPAPLQQARPSGVLVPLTLLPVGSAGASTPRDGREVSPG